MAIIASDTFTGISDGASISGRTLNNGLGGTGSFIWETNGTAALLGDGANRIKADSGGAFSNVPISGLTSSITKVLFDPSGGTSDIQVTTRKNVAPGAATFVSLQLKSNHTSLGLYQGNGLSDYLGDLVGTPAAITAPGVPFYIQIAISGSTATGKIIRASDSVELASVSYTFGTIPVGDYQTIGFAGGTSTGRFDDFIVEDGVAGDVTAPTLTSATATATSATAATGGVTTDEAGPAWAVLTTSNTTPSAAQIKAGQNHTGAAASASATATLAVGANSGVFSFTGLTAGQTYWEHVVQDDAVPNTSTPITSASSITTPTPDTTPPTMNGSITVGTKTSGSISISYPAASDNVAVTGYEVSTNGSTWSDNGTSLSYTFLGLSALTSYTLYVRAYDAAGNRAATPLTVTTSTYREGDTAANIIANTGPVGGNPEGFMRAFAATVSPTDWVSYRILSGPTPPGGTLTANPDGTFTYFGPEPASLVVQPEVNGVNAAETITVTLYDQTGEVPDTDPPVLSAATAYASSATTAAGTVTTNEATGTLYFLRNNSATATDVAVKAGLSQAVTASGIQTVNVTGLTASTPGNYIHYLHRDGSGNDSLVSSSAAFATPAPPAPGMKVIGAKPTKVSARPIARPIAGKPTD